MINQFGTLNQNQFVFFATTFTFACYFSRSSSTEKNSCAKFNLNLQLNCTVLSVCVTVKVQCVLANQKCGAANLRASKNINVHQSLETKLYLFKIIANNRNAHTFYFDVFFKYNVCVFIYTKRRLKKAITYQWPKNKKSCLLILQWTIRPNNLQRLKTAKLSVNKKMFWNRCLLNLI